MSNDLTVNPVPDRKGYVVFFILIFFLMAYASFLTWDVVTRGHGSLYTVVLKYGSILLTFLLTLMIGKDDHDVRDRTLLQLAFLFSATGDFFLIIMTWFFSAQSGTWFLCGMAAFFCTQIMLIIRHSRDFVWNRIEIISAIIIYGFVASIMISLLPYIETSLILPILIYAVALTTSLWMGIGTLWRPYYRMTIAVMIAIGVSCFFMCDLNVVLGEIFTPDAQQIIREKFGLDLVLPHTIPDVDIQVRKPLALPEGLVALFGIIMWVFYLPAQVLLSTSGYKLKFLRSIVPALPPSPPR